MIDINRRPVPHTTLFSFGKYTQTERYGKNSIKYQSRKLWNSLQQILQIDLLQPTRGEAKNLIFWTLLQHLLKLIENWTNEDTLHHKRTQSAQTYNTFKHWISKYQISLLYIAALTIKYIMNITFPSLPLLPSPFPNTRYSSSSTTHQYNNLK